MQKLISRAKHPVRHQVLRYVAAVLLAILTLFGAVFAVSPEVRASVNGWVRKGFGGELHYFFTGEHTQPPAEYELTALPEDAQLLEVLQTEGGKTYLYLLNGKSLLEFKYVHAADYTTSVEGMGYHTVTVNGQAADLYLAIQKEYTSMIIWQDPVECTVFHIVAHADREELIKMAESVRKIEKSE